MRNGAMSRRCEVCLMIERSRSHAGAMDTNACSVLPLDYNRPGRAWLRSLLSCLPSNRGFQKNQSGSPSSPGIGRIDHAAHSAGFREQLRRGWGRASRRPRLSRGVSVPLSEGVAAEAKLTQVRRLKTDPPRRGVFRSGGPHAGGGGSGGDPCLEAAGQRAFARSRGCSSWSASDYNRCQCLGRD